MLKKVGFILSLLILTAFSSQKIFAINPQYINPNLIQLLPTPTPTPTPTLIPIHFPLIPLGTVNPTSTPTPTPTPTASPLGTTSSTNNPAATQNSPVASVTPTTQTSPNVSPTPTTKPNQQQILVAGLNKETLIISLIVILIVVIIFLTRWNIIKKWLNRKST